MPLLVTKWGSGKVTKVLCFACYGASLRGKTLKGKSRRIFLASATGGRCKPRARIPPKITPESLPERREACRRSRLAPDTGPRVDGLAKAAGVSLP